jgi:hypothetical protein
LSFDQYSKLSREKKRRRPDVFPMDRDTLGGVRRRYRINAGGGYRGRIP